MTIPTNPNTTLVDLIKKPDISNRDLEAIIKLNSPKDQHVTVSTFALGKDKQPARSIRFSPYNIFKDMLISIKRVFVGVKFGKAQDFPTLPKDTDLIPLLKQGRRVKIIFTNKGEYDSTVIEQDRPSLIERIRQKVSKIGK